MRLVVALIAALLFARPAGAAEELPIFDAHIHYSHDAWSMLPPAEAIAVLRKAGLRKALVSSSSDDGTQKLYDAAPDLIVPELRPYRTRGELSTWLRDPTVIQHLEDRLARYKYVGIGEFHVFGADADLPVMRRVVELAKSHGLILHLHGDAEAIDRVFAQDPTARILWAHSGFDRPERLRPMLSKYANLWADLAVRSDHASGGKLDPEWLKLFTEFPDRFMLGTDTYTPERWHYVAEHASWSRAWLADLPRDLAEKLAYRNAEALLLGERAPSR